MTDSLTLRIKVKPRARQEGLVEESRDSWVASVKAQPVEGRANLALIRLVAARFRVPQSAVTIKSGASSRVKLVQVAGIRHKSNENEA